MKEALYWAPSSEEARHRRVIALGYEPLRSRPRLRVLYLTHHSPWPATSGGRLRDAWLVPELARLVDIEVWAISRTPNTDRVTLDQKQPTVTVRLFRNEAPPRRYPTRDSSSARTLLRQQVADGSPFDIVHVEGHYLFHLVPDELVPRTVIVEHNVESNLLRQRAAHDRSGAGLRDDLVAVSKAEEHVWTRAALVLTLSEEDRQRILRRLPGVPVQTCANGADHAPLRLPTRSGHDRWSSAPRIGFLANYAYEPNRDATRWLLEEILPRIRGRIAGAQLVLAGAHLHEAVQASVLPPSVTAMGWIDHVDTLWEALDLMICPLRIGGGVKVKMLEAIRGGCLIVSTGVGLEGLPPAARSAVVRADDADQLVDAVIRLCMDENLRDEHRRRVMLAQHEQLTWSDAASMLYEHWLHVSRSSLVGGVVGR